MIVNSIEIQRLELQVCGRDLLMGNNVLNGFLYQSAKNPEDEKITCIIM